MFRKREFIPMFGKYTGQVCWGIEFLPISGDFFTVTFKMLQISSVIHEELEINEWFNTLMGDKRVSEILKNGEFPGDIMKKGRGGFHEFRRRPPLSRKIEAPSKVISRKFNTQIVHIFI